MSAHACTCVLLMCRGVLPLVNVLLKASWLFMREIHFFSAPITGPTFEV